MKERRLGFRWQINRQTRLKLEGAECFCDCQVKNINLKGAQIHLGLKLPKDAFLKFCLFLAQDCLLNIEGWVVWHKTINDTNGYGVYFTKLKDRDKEKICQFVQRHYPEQVKRQCWQGGQDVNVCEEGGETMAEMNFQDRRIFERFQAGFPLKFLDLTSNKEGKGEIQDVSAKGIGLVTSERLRENTQVELWLQIPDKGEPLYARGEVVWSSQVSPSEHRVGVNLDKANLMGLSRLLREA